MVYRELGDGPSFPQWVREMRGRSGVYVIRAKGWLGLGAPVVLYVGESHNGKLYGTFTRHFQEWRGPTAGQQYPRSQVSVGFVVTRADKAQATQRALIARLSPSDNSYCRPPAPDDGTPF